jgi:ribA/ribD-fused uncharacterized protein
MIIDSFRGRWSFLSNFYPSQIIHKGIKYPTMEHYYVAMKVNGNQLVDGNLLDKIDVRELISKIETPGRVKRFGRTLKLRGDWEEIKDSFMLWGLREKFKDPVLSELLISTGDSTLIEGNSWCDNYWGSCDCQKCTNIVGKNMLGVLLERVRSEIINGGPNDLGSIFFK